MDCVLSLRFIFPMKTALIKAPRPVTDNNRVYPSTPSDKQFMAITGKPTCWGPMMHRLRIAVKSNNNIKIGCSNKSLKAPCWDAPLSWALSFSCLFSLQPTLQNRKNAVTAETAMIGYALSLVFSTRNPAKRGPTSVAPWLMNCITEFAFCR